MKQKKKQARVKALPEPTLNRAILEPIKIKREKTPLKPKGTFRS